MPTDKEGGEWFSVPSKGFIVGDIKDCQIIRFRFRRRYHFYIEGEEYEDETAGEKSLWIVVDHEFILTK